MFKLKWWIVGAWVLVLVVLGLIVSQVGFNTSSEISIPGTQAQQTLTRFNELFPDTGAQSAKVVIEVANGKTVNDYKNEINQLSKDIATVPGVTTSVSPFDNLTAISKNNTIAFITVQMKGDGDSGREEGVAGNAV